MVEELLDVSVNAIRGIFEVDPLDAFPLAIELITVLDDCGYARTGDVYMALDNELRTTAMQIFSKDDPQSLLLILDLLTLLIRFGAVESAAPLLDAFLTPATEIIVDMLSNEKPEYIPHIFRLIDFGSNEKQLQSLWPDLIPGTIKIIINMIESDLPEGIENAFELLDLLDGSDQKELTKCALYYDLLAILFSKLQMLIDSGDTTEGLPMFLRLLHHVPSVCQDPGSLEDLLPGFHDLLLPVTSVIGSMLTTKTPEQEEPVGLPISFELMELLGEAKCPQEKMDVYINLREPIFTTIKQMFSSDPEQAIVLLSQLISLIPDQEEKKNIFLIFQEDFSKVPWLRIVQTDSSILIIALDLLKVANLYPEMIEFIQFVISNICSSANECMYCISGLLKSMQNTPLTKNEQLLIAVRERMIFEMLQLFDSEPRIAVIRIVEFLRLEGYDTAFLLGVFNALTEKLFSVLTSIEDLEQRNAVFTHIMNFIPVQEVKTILSELNSPTS